MTRSMTSCLHCRFARRRRSCVPAAIIALITKSPSAGKCPEYPSIFGRFASSFSAHRQAILKPKAGDELDYEGELVVVMGKAGRHVSKRESL